MKTLNHRNTIFQPFGISRPPYVAPRVIPNYEAKFINELLNRVSDAFHPNLAENMLAVKRVSFS